MYWKVCFSFSLIVFSQFLCFYIPYIYIVYKYIDSFALKLSGELKNKQRMDVSGIFRQTC